MKFYHPRTLPTRGVDLQRLDNFSKTEKIAGKSQSGALKLFRRVPVEKLVVGESLVAVVSKRSRPMAQELQSQ